MIHEKNVILKNLMFNVDVNMALQLISQYLPASEATYYIDKDSNITISKNMTGILAYHFHNL